MHAGGGEIRGKMEVEVAALPWHNDVMINSAKRKRSKRVMRPHSPIPNHRPSAAAATEEEEETARCLILLARGSPPHDSNNMYSSVMYTCKTCNRAFSSFQALGGHRTSHKKHHHPKSPPPFSDQDSPPPSKKSRTPPPPGPNSLSLQLFVRTHECSYCGAQFTSGQALGGHMRRHRPGPITPSPTPLHDLIKKPAIGLSLDLNFPAPEDEFEFVSARTQKSPEKMAVSTTAGPTLVDCHF